MLAVVHFLGKASKKLIQIAEKGVKFQYILTYLEMHFDVETSETKKKVC